MKKILSVVLSVVILMSMMVTGFTVGAASTDKATINGKEVSVGSVYLPPYRETTSAS